jgi:hypothetical protein
MRATGKQTFVFMFCSHFVCVRRYSELLQSLLMSSCKLDACASQVAHIIMCTVVFTLLYVSILVAAAAEPLNEQLQARCMCATARYNTHVHTLLSR